MNRYHLILTFITIIFFVELSLIENFAYAHEHGHKDQGKHEKFTRGPHQGRILESGRFQIELSIFETGVEPHFRIYSYYDGIQLPSTDLKASVTLTRVGGKTERFYFRPVDQFLVSDATVHQPHSFNVSVTAEYQNHEYKWDFDSYEGRTSISDEVARLSGIRTAYAQERLLRTFAQVRGKIVPSEHKITHVIPRFPGIVREGRKHIGDRVDKGEVVAIVESNQSLQPYEVRSQIAGTVINGHVIAGEYAAENQWIYIVADLTEVWADFYIPLRDKLSIAKDHKISIRALNSEEVTDGTVAYVAPYADERSQTQLVRMVLQNGKLQYLPGAFVSGELLLSEAQVSVAVKRSAIQRFREWEVVFVKVGEIYEVKPIELGRSDEEWIEVISGLDAGEEYVSENSFLLKADILKSGASHDH